MLVILWKQGSGLHRNHELSKLSRPEFLPPVPALFIVPLSAQPMNAFFACCLALVVSIVGFVFPVQADVQPELLRDNTQDLALTQPPAQGRGNLKNDVLYYIQVDRFADGEPQNNIPREAFPVEEGIDPQTQGYHQANQVLLPYLYDPTHRYINLYWGGDLAGITKQLDYLESLGVTQLVLSPIQNMANGLIYDPGSNGYLHDRVDPKQESYDPFYAHASAGFNRAWTIDWWDIDEHFRSDLDPNSNHFASFQALLNAAQDHHIGIILELNLNHASPDRGNGPYQAFDPKTYQKWLADSGAIYQQGKAIAAYGQEAQDHGEPWFHSQQYIDYNRPTPEALEKGMVDGLPDLNHDNPEVVNYLLGAIEFWLRFNQDQTPISGLYLTSIPNVPLGFWQQLEALVQEIRPDTILIADYGDGGYRNLNSMDWYGQTQDFDLVNYSFSVAARRFFGRDRGWDGRTMVLREDSLGQQGQYYNYSLPEKLLHFVLNPSQSLEIPRSSLDQVAPEDAQAWINFLEAANQTRLLTYYPQMTQTAYASAIKFLFTSPGVPLLFYGVETGLAVPYHIDHRSPFGPGGDPFNEPMMIWPGDGGWDTTLHHLTQALGQLRRDYPLLRYGSTHFAFPQGSKRDKDLFMVRQSQACGSSPSLGEGDCAAIVYSYATEGGDFLLSLRESPLDGGRWTQVKNVETGQVTPITDRLVPIHLDPEESKVLVLQ